MISENCKKIKKNGFGIFGARFGLSLDLGCDFEAILGDLAFIFGRFSNKFRRFLDGLPRPV